jgi:hypothetical protein
MNYKVFYINKKKTLSMHFHLHFLNNSHTTFDIASPLFKIKREFNNNAMYKIEQQAK